MNNNNILPALVLSVTALSLSACSLVQQAHHVAILGDGLTTAYALDVAGAAEANPLLRAIGGDSGLMVSAVSSAVSYGLLYGAREYGSDADCKRVYNSLTTLKMGAVGNNLAVLAGLGEPLGLGLLAGLVAWHLLSSSNAAHDFCTPEGKGFSPVPDSYGTYAYG